MKVLLCHNYYQQPGGEDLVFADEAALLDSYGHSVFRHEIHNDTIRDRSKVAVARDTIWNRRVGQQLSEIVQRHDIEVVHFHNTFPLISPVAYHAVRMAGAAVVQTLHNFRLLCPGAMLLRNGSPCEKCVGRRVAWPGLVHACYRQDRAATCVTVGMLALHHAAGTYRRNVDMYIALTEFARRKFIQGGLPAEKVVVKSNFLRRDPGPGTGGGEYAVFVGRLSSEKGVATLLDAWAQLAESTRLLIVGDGPLAGRVAEAAAGDARLQPLGWKAPDEVLRIIGDAACLVTPSICYENFPRTVAEALAMGTPLIASRLGAMAELVEHGRTGVHFEPGDARDLASAVSGLLSTPTTLGEMRREARRVFEERYSAEINYQELMVIYQQARRHRVPLATDESARNDCHRLEFQAGEPVTASPPEPKRS